MHIHDSGGMGTHSLQPNASIQVEGTCKNLPDYWAPFSSIPSDYPPKSQQLASPLCSPDDNATDHAEVKHARTFKGPRICQWGHGDCDMIHGLCYLKENGWHQRRNWGCTKDMERYAMVWGLFYFRFQSWARLQLQPEGQTSSAPKVSFCFVPFID